MCRYEKITGTVIFKWQNVYNMIPFVLFLNTPSIYKSDF